MEIHFLKVDGLSKVVVLYMGNTLFMNFNYTNSLEKAMAFQWLS